MVKLKNSKFLVSIWHITEANAIVCYKCSRKSVLTVGAFMSAILISKRFWNRLKSSL